MFTPPRAIQHLLQLCMISAITAVVTLVACAAAPARQWRVEGGDIRNAQNQVVQLNGISWFGFETEIHTVHGLWARNLADVVRQLQGAGFNAVRLPICPDTLRGQPIKEGIDYALNPALQGMSSLEVLDAVIAELSGQGLYVLLGHHRPNCSLQAPLWYTAAYSERQWINDLRFMAERYRSNPMVLGLDLKNEPHAPATWGKGDKTTDWNQAVERAGKAVLDAAPHWLLFVQGMGDSGTCSPLPNNFWGENLQGVACAPLKLPKDRIVFSPHSYGPDIADQPYFGGSNFTQQLPALWDKRYGYLRQQGYAVVPGEFGGGYGKCATDADRQWQNAYVQYLIQRGMRSAFYWSLNPNSQQTGGLLQSDWKDFWPDKLALLQHLHSNGQTPLPPLTTRKDPSCNTSAPPAPLPAPVNPSSTPEPGERGILMPVSETDSCATVRVRNPTDNPMAWQIALPITTGGKPKGEGLRFLPRDAQSVWMSGTDARATLAPGEQVELRYCW